MRTTPINQTSDIGQALQFPTWIYRSYHNHVELVGDDPDKALGLIFGEGVFTLSENHKSVSGKFVMGPDYVLDLRGELANANGVIRMDLVGKGLPSTPTADWQYDYQAFLCPTWPTSINQVPAFVGTVLRAVQHNGAPAGVTASFVLLADVLSASNSRLVQS
jgi:hypothetical protein